MAGVGSIVSVIELALKMLGIEAPEGSVLGAVNGIVAAGGLVLLVWGQLRRKDLFAGLVRKDPEN